MRLRRFLAARRRVAVALVLGLCAVGVVAGLVVEQARGPQWQSTSNVQVQFWAVNPYLLSGQATPVLPEDVADVAALALSENVLDRTADELDDGRNRAQLAADLTVTPQPVSHLVSVVATAPSAEQARRTAVEVVAAMLESAEDRIDSAVAATGQSTDVRQRADTLDGSMELLVDLGATEPRQVSPSARTPLAFGIVGFAAGALVVIGVVFLGPTLVQSRDAQRQTGLPTATFRPRDDDGELAVLLQVLMDERPDGSIALVPVRPDADQTARRCLDWATERSPQETAKRLVLTGPPKAAVLTRPDDVSAVLLVVSRGTPRVDLADAVDLLKSWRPVDMVVFAP